MVKASQYVELANDLEINKAITYLRQKDFNQVSQFSALVLQLTKNVFDDGSRSHCVRYFNPFWSFFLLYSLLYEFIDMFVIILNRNFTINLVLSKTSMPNGKLVHILLEKKSKKKIKQFLSLKTKNQTCKGKIKMYKSTRNAKKRSKQCEKSIK